MGSSSEGRPNVVVVYTDDQNFEHIGAYGHDVLTPHQDRLGEEGVRFTRAYATTSVCTPSRYGCMTGQFPSRCSHPSFREAFPAGVQLEPSFNTLLDPRAPNLASVMQAAGYATGMVGKWHLGAGLKQSPEERGLKPLPRSDAWTATPGEVDPRDPKVSENLRENHAVRVREMQAFGFDFADRLCENPEAWALHSLNVHNWEWVVEGALNFIDANKDRPFFLYLAPTLHHIPHPQESLLQADPRITVGGYLDEAPDVMPSREDVVARVRAAGLAPEAAYCTWLDDGIGAVLRKLEALGLEENTLIVFFSDHQTHAKGTLYEGGVRAPCMMRWPARIRGGQVCSGLAQNIDFAPTIFEACGVSAPGEMGIDGRSLLPMLVGEREAVHEALFFEIGWTRAVCTDRWKYLALRYSKAAEALAKKRGTRLYHNLALEPHQHHALLDHPNFWDPDQLYDLALDSTETTNFAYDGRREGVLREMQERLGGWLRGFGDHPFGEFVG